jgi:thymidylate synthase (FAD)
MEKSVKIVGTTRSWIDGISDSDLIAYVARVSNPSNQMNTLTAPKLIKYLVTNSHWSPLEMVSATLEINTTRDISRQILRHRSFSFQEFSQRYAEVGALETENIVRETRLQDTKNRQNSIEVEDEKLETEWQWYQNEVSAAARTAYKWAIKNGIAKEQARVVLPEGLTPTRLYMAGTLRSWYHYCNLRSENGTQKEHRQIAIECWDVITEKYPDLKELI